MPSAPYIGPSPRSRRRRNEWTKEMTLEKRKATLLGECASRFGVDVMGSSCPPLLPPLESTPLGNLDLLGSTSVLFECPACPPSVDNHKTKIPIGLLEQHRAWHVRVNALIELRTRTKDAGGNAQHFGPGYPGILAMLEYIYKVRRRGTKVLGKWLTRGEFVMRKRMEPLVTLKYMDGLQYTVGNTFLGRQKQGEFVFFDMKEMALEDEDNDYDYDSNSDYDYDSDSDDGNNSSDEEEESDGDKKEVATEASDEEEKSDEDKEEEDAKEENYFTLTCKNEGIWISKNETEASCHSTMVSVNGVPLVQHPGRPDCCEDDTEPVSKSRNQEPECHCKRRLEFGDVVSISHGDGGKFIDFLFKISNSNKGRSVDTDDGGSGPKGKEVVFVNNAVVLENSLVLKNILPFLPTTKLQGFRSLSHLWNTEALKALRSRVTVRPFQGSIESDSSPDDHMQISTYASSQMNELRFPNWELTLEQDWISWSPRERMMTMGYKKLAEDFAWFFDTQSHTHKVRSLTLFGNGGKAATRTTFTLFETVLRAPGVKNHLTSLYLSFGASYGQALPPALEEMPSLRDLTLCIDRSRGFGPFFFQAFNKTFLSAVGSIRSLKLKKPINFADRAPFQSYVLSGIAQLQPLKFQHLSQVFLASGGDAHIGPLANLRKGSLKSLTLLECNPGELIFSTPLRLVLERHGDSLEELSLHFDIRIRAASNLSINFPHQMPKLRNLEILLCVTGREEPIAPPRFRFGGLASPTVTSFDYTSVFPSIQSLTVWPVAVITRRYPGYHGRHDDDIPIKSVEGTEWETFLPILRPFVTPSSPSPVHSLRRVDVPFLFENKYNSVLDNLERTFPSTEFPPALTRARLRPICRSPHPLPAQPLPPLPAQPLPRRIRRPPCRY